MSREDLESYEQDVINAFESLQMSIDSQEGKERDELLNDAKENIEYIRSELVDVIYAINALEEALNEED